ncbi:MAG: hypothetical protein II332_04555 [Kiritimatiellae bacterium]|nr:hypothetical protein [Kiritimatiellia bacterium]
MKKYFFRISRNLRFLRDFLKEKMKKSEILGNFGKKVVKGTAKGRLKPPAPMSLRRRLIKNAANYDVFKEEAN